jgi:UDP-N-acetyl-D-mannosaminuronic acid transferase (WecB/TagA/CpsF family)
VGANVESKQKQTLFYFGGVPAYFAAVKKEIQDGYPGYKFSTAVQTI